MPIPSKQYSAIESLRREPLYLRHAREIAKQPGGIPSAAAELFERANITISVIGSTSEWAKPDTGTLLVGDHRNKIEFAPLLAALNRFGRNDVHFVQKPFSTNAKIIRALGEPSNGVSLPVIPRTLARDRKNVFNRDLGWRIALKNNLPTTAQLAQLNEGTLQRAARLLVLGRVVVLYPTGGVSDANCRPWQRGLGSIVKRLPHSSRDSVQVALFRFDNFSTSRIVASLTLQAHGIDPPPYSLTLRMGPQGTVSGLLGGHPVVDVLEPAEISERLRRSFVRFFGKES